LAVFLARGSTGEAVADLQRRLRALGFLPAGGLTGARQRGGGELRIGVALSQDGGSHGAFGGSDHISGGPGGVSGDPVGAVRPAGPPGSQGPVQAVGDPSGHFDEWTETAVRSFQEHRGLRVDGICGPQTWAAVVEAGYWLGDRLLYRRRPLLRGDDVAELQSRLSALGFDPGRIDGIFGDHTGTALAEFQRNVGLPVDGICGRATLRELDRLRAHTSDQALIPAIREREKLRRSPRTLAGRRIAIGHGGELGPVVENLRRALVTSGAIALGLLHPDGSRRALQANALDAEVYLGLELNPRLSCNQVAFYRGYHESAGGRRLATLLASALTALEEGREVPVVGMTVPEVRETRMTAALCDLHNPVLAVERAPELADALRAALVAWATAPWD
jgi:N-acetylmuramoyl-L-alanine amidase